MPDEEKIEDKDLPSPRFDLISKMFDEIDTILATYDQKEHLSIFEMEILVLMVRKKIEHFGIMTALEPHEHETTSKGNPDVYN